MNSLRDFIKLVTEAPLVSSDGTPVKSGTGSIVTTGTTPTPAAVAPGSNPWTNDPVKAAAWDKLSPQVQKKLGMADPTDNIIVGRMVKGGILSGPPATDANPDGTPKVKAPVATAPVATAIPVADPASNAVPNSPPAQSGKPAPVAADPEKEKKVAKFKELLTKAGVLTADSATNALGVTPQANIPGSPTAVKESVTFKSNIGRMLLESFDIGLEEAAATQLSPEEYKELSKLYGDLSVTYKDDATLAPLFAAYDKVKPSWAADNPPVDTASTSASLPPGTNLGIAQMQKELKAQGADLGTFGPNKDGIDGKIGGKTKQAMKDFPDIAKKYGFGADTPTASAPTAAAPAGKQPVAQSGKPAAPKTLADFDTQIKSVSDKLTQLYKVDPNSPATKAAQAELQTVVAAKAKMMQAGNKPVDQSGKPAGGAYALTNTPEYKQLVAIMNAAYKSSGPESVAYKQAVANLTAFVDKNKPVTETTSFANDEVQRIVSLVHYR